MGGKVVTKILESPELREKWKNEFKERYEFLRKNILLLKEKLEINNIPGDWNYLNQIKVIFYFY
jgi:aspartate/tyrosine/aromatic aminotransferase